MSTRLLAYNVTTHDTSRRIICKVSLPIMIPDREGVVPIIPGYDDVSDSHAPTCQLIESRCRSEAVCTQSLALHLEPGYHCDLQIICCQTCCLQSHHRVHAAPRDVAIVLTLASNRLDVIGCRNHCVVNTGP